ncbi:MAG: carbohydrate ABC transporter permease [Christensenellales bacterium]
MTQEKKPGQLTGFVKPKGRIGFRRLVVHILLLGILGALLLGGGLFGLRALRDASQGARQSAYIDALHSLGMDAAAALMKSAARDEALAAAVDQTLSVKKRGLKSSVTAMRGEDKTDSEILNFVLDTLQAGLRDRFSDPKVLEAVDATAAAGRAELILQVSARAQQAVAELDLGGVRKSLSPTALHYPFMYFYQALLISGVIGLLLCLLLIYVWFSFDGERKVRVAQWLEPIDYLLPFTAGVLVFTLYPVVRVVIMSFQERYRLDGSFTGWGMGNYAHVLGGIPGTTNYFMQGLTNTLLFVLYTVPASTLLAIIIAYLLNQKLRFSALFQTAYFLPMVTSVTAVGLVWRWMFNRQHGLLNAILALFGVERINWLQQAGNSLPVLVIFAVWSSLPFAIILLLSGLQNIDETYYTVARVDGAKALRIFRRITLPLLAPTVGLVLTINSISAFKVFTEVTVLFNGQPGPTKNLYTVVYYIFEVMRGDSLEHGRAAAAAIVLFLLIFLFTMLQRFIQRKWHYT